MCIRDSPYVAKAKLKGLIKYMPVSMNHISTETTDELYWSEEIEYEPVFQLGNNVTESIAMLNKVEELCKKFPGLDCGSCGAPTCKALAEDIVRGIAKESDCIHILRDQVHVLSLNFSELAADIIDGRITYDDSIGLLKEYIQELKEKTDKDTPKE